MECDDRRAVQDLMDSIGKKSLRPQVRSHTLLVGYPVVLVTTHYQRDNWESSVSERVMELRGQRRSQPTQEISLDRKMDFPPGPRQREHVFLDRVTFNGACLWFKNPDNPWQLSMTPNRGSLELFHF